MQLILNLCLPLTLGSVIETVISSLQKVFGYRPSNTGVDFSWQRRTKKGKGKDCADENFDIGCHEQWTSFFGNSGSSDVLGEAKSASIFSAISSGLDRF